MMIEALVPILQVPHRVIVVSFLRLHIPGRRMRVRDDPGRILGNDRHFLRQKRLVSRCRRRKARRGEWQKRDMVLERMVRGVSISNMDRRELLKIDKRPHTRIVNLGKTKPGFTFFPTSISPCSTRLPSTGAPSSLGHQNALLRCSGNVLLLRRGADSSVASDPMAIVRVRNTVVAEGCESRSIACESGHVRVSKRGIGEPRAYES